MDKNLQRFRWFALAGSLCAVVSLFVGGVMLDLLGFILGYSSYSKVKRLRAENPNDPYIQVVFRLARNSMCFCVIAAVLNLAAALLFLPSMMDEILESATSSPAF